MADPQPRDELALLIDLARSAEAPVLHPWKARRMARDAMARAERSSAPRRWQAYAAAAAVLLSLGTWASTQVGRTRHPTRVEVASDGVPLRLSLRSGDALVLAREAEIEVLSEAPRLRKLRLARGAVLFDVARLQQGQGFQVETPDALVQVRGTVFTLQVDASARTSVEVHEGSVHVAGRTLRAGERWSSGQGVGSAAALFAEDIRAALMARSAPTLSKVAEGSTPTVTPLPPSAEPVVSEPTAPTRAVDLESAEALLRAGEFDAVLALLSARAETDVRAARLVSDALRAKGQFAEAVEAYERLADKSRGNLRIEAGFAAAQLALSPLKAPARALSLLDRFQLDASDSPLRERASLVRVEALVALQRLDEARAQVARYLQREPETAASERLKELVRGPSAEE